MRTWTFSFLCLAGPFLLACGDEAPAAPVVDMGTSDAGVDSGTPDVGESDPGEADTNAEDACVASCEGLECGDDGCGGSCGECAGACVEGLCDDVVPATCPAEGPFGTAVGDIAADVELFDCSGESVRLHELCDHDVTWLFSFADWCPPCRSFARNDAQNIYDANAGDEFEAYFVISADSSFGAPSQELCREITERYGLSMPVLFDPTGALQTTLGIDPNSQDVVFSRGMRIEWIGKYAGDEVQAQISAL